MSQRRRFRTASYMWDKKYILMQHSGQQIPPPGMMMLWWGGCFGSNTLQSIWLYQSSGYENHNHSRYVNLEEFRWPNDLSPQTKQEWISRTKFPQLKRSDKAKLQISMRPMSCDNHEIQRRKARRGNLGLVPVAFAYREKQIFLDTTDELHTDTHTDNTALLMETTWSELDQMKQVRLSN